jgi:hypothetical protein
MLLKLLKKLRQESLFSSLNNNFLIALEDLEILDAMVA